MAESESLRDFVARHRHLPPDEALELVLSMPKVQAWIGSDASRGERLRDEFRRIWDEDRPRPAAQAGAQQVVVQNAPAAHVGPAHERADAVALRQVPAPARAAGRVRHEKFLCTNCGGYDIYSEFDGEAVRVRCRQCKVEYPDLLQLVPVIEVGPIELFFGKGREAWIKLGALVTLWAAVYLLLKMLV